MPATIAGDKWQESVTASYFVRFNDNHFGRFDFSFKAFERPRIQFEAHLNPKIGSRNLAADPDKQY